jgi:hypothetical protein
MGCGSAEIVEELGARCDTRNQKMIPGTRTGDIQQVTLGLVDLLEVGWIGDSMALAPLFR